MNAGCTGFCDALLLANSLQGKTLIVTADTYRKYLNASDQTTRYIFSDGGSMVLYNPKYVRVEKVKVDCFGDENECLERKHVDGGYIEMKGSEVAQFVFKSVIPSLKKITQEKIYKKIYIHQASKYVLDNIEEALKNQVTRESIPRNLEYRGNLVSSSIPYLFQDCGLERGKHLLVGFGVGISITIVNLEIS